MEEAYPNRKTQKLIRKELRKHAAAETTRIYHNIIANRPFYLPRFIWGRIVRIVLERRPAGGQAGE